MTINAADLLQSKDHQHFEPCPPQDRDREVTLALVGEGMRVLAISPTPELAKGLAGQGCHVVALSSSRAGCAPLRRHCTAVLHGDPAKFNLGQLIRGRKFDVVLLGEALQDAADPVGLLRRLSPYLSKTGTMITSVANFAHASARLALLDGSRAWRHSGLDPRRFFTLELLEQALEAAGLAVAAIERVAADPYLDPFGAGTRWDRASVPPAIKLLIERDPEAEVARYVVRIARGGSPAATEELGDEPAPGHEPVRALLDELEQRALAQPELEAREAQQAAEARVTDLESQLDDARQRDTQLNAQLDALVGLRAEHERLQTAKDLAETERDAAQADRVDRQRELDELRRRTANHEEQLAESALKLQQRDRALRAKAEAERLLRRQLDEQSATAERVETELRAELAELEQGALAAERRLRAELDGARKLAEERRHELDEADRRVAESALELQATQERTDEARFEWISELSVLWARRDDQQRALEAEIDLRALIEHRLTEVEQARATTAQRLERSRGDALRLSKAVDRLWGQLTRSEEDLERAEERAAERRLADGATHEAAIRELRLAGEERLARVQATTEGLQLELDAELARGDLACARADALAEELTLADRLLAESARERVALYERWDELEQERDMARRALELDRARLARAAEALEVFQGQLDGESARADAAESDAAESGRDADLLRQQVDGGRQRQLLLSQDLERLEGENRTLAIELDEAQALGEQARSETSDLDARRAAATRRARLAQLALDTFQRQLDQEQARTRWAEARLESLERTVAQEREHLKQRDAELEALNAEIEARLEQAGAELEQATGTMTAQLGDLEQELGQSRREAQRSAGETTELRRRLGLAERATRELQGTLTSRSAHLDAELERVRRSLAYRVLGHCDRAREALLPTGSRRRAAYDRLLTLAGGSPRALIEVDTIAGSDGEPSAPPASSALTLRYPR